MRQAQLGRHGRPQRRGAVTLGGVVAACQIGHPALARQVGLRLGQFAGDKGIGPGSDGRLEITLRPAAAPRNAAQGATGGGVDERHGPPQLLLHVCRQGKGVGAIGVAHKAQILFAKAAPAVGQGAKAQALRQLGVVAQAGVGVERQVVGQQAHVVRQQQRQPLLHPAGDAGALAAPKQAVMHQNGVGPGRNGALDQFAAGRDAADQVPHPRPALDLQAVGAVVLKALGLQRGVEALEQHAALDGLRSAGAGS